MNMARTVKCLGAAAAALMMSTSAISAERTMAMRWESSDPNIYAYGSLTFEDVLGFNGSVYYVPKVYDLMLTVLGSGPGDGTFHLSDFEGVVFWFPSPLDFNRELIGQPLANGYRFGVEDMDGQGGSLTLCGSGGSSGNAPTCVFFFAIGVNNGQGTSMEITSISPVPEPATGAVMVAGLLVVASRLRQRRAAASGGV